MGTPEAMYDQSGSSTWSCSLSSYGRVRKFEGHHKTDCPFRYQGQYEDSETGLYFNRFRYYSPEEGIYISQHLIRLKGGDNLYGYVHDPNEWVDELGLASRKSQFREAKRAASIPASSQHTTHRYVYDSSSENRTVYEFNVDGKKKYVVLHEEDKMGRGPHFHGADDAKGSPMDKGRYNQYDGHFPEDEEGFEKKGGCNE